MLVTVAAAAVHSALRPARVLATSTPEHILEFSTFMTEDNKPKKNKMDCKLIRIMKMNLILCSKETLYIEDLFVFKNNTNIIVRIYYRFTRCLKESFANFIFINTT